MKPITDPLGLIGSINRELPALPVAGGGADRGPGFRQVLTDQIDKVNQLQQAAK